jgi:hypothetical protein
VEGTAGKDVSLRTYVNRCSQARADLVGAVLDPVSVPLEDVPPSFLAGEYEQSLRAQGFDAAALVFLRSGPGAGQAQGLFAYWARFAMAEGVGVWAMELTHVLTGYADLYTDDTANDLGAFDNMDCACGTHPTAYTKLLIGWLDPSATVVLRTQRGEYDLHSLGLVQPPPPGRTTAVRIETGGNPLFVESRQRVDQFDGGGAWYDSGIPDEGVIVYEQTGVENPNAGPEVIDPLLRLRTPTALHPGNSYTSDSGVVVTVTAALAGGFRVDIENPAGLVEVPEVLEDSPAQATTKILGRGLVPSFTGPNDQHSWVWAQSPKAGTLVAQGGTVELTLRSGLQP